MDDFIKSLLKPQRPLKEEFDEFFTLVGILLLIGVTAIVLYKIVILLWVPLVIIAAGLLTAAMIKYYRS